MKMLNKTTLRRIEGALCVGFSLLLGAGIASAQTLAPAGDYPSRSITLISPFPPGGGNDGVARLLAQELGIISGQAVVVENRAGAGGNLGTSAVARAKPDGYTLVLSQNSVMAVNPTIYKKTGFDPLKDFVAVSQITSAPLALVVRAESPYKTLADYVAAARQKPEAVTFATPGNGTLSHLAGALLEQKKSVKLVHVPYKGAGPAINDLLGGTVDMLITSPASVESLVSSSKLRVLAMTGESRVGVFQGKPTLGQQGVEGASIEGWYGVFAPAGTPADRVAYLAEAIGKATKAQAVIAKINQDGAEVVASKPDVFAKKLADEITYWKEVVKASHIAID